LPHNGYSRKTSFHYNENPKRSVTKIVGLICILLVLVITISFLVLKSEKNKIPPADQRTLCPPDEFLSELNVLLLDVSDKFSEPQRFAIVNELGLIKGEIKKLGLFEVYTVEADGLRIKRPRFRLCNPGTGADLNRLYQNPDLARKRWEAFSRQLDSEIGELIATPASPISAIFEAVQSTALLTFNRPEYANLPKHLIIVSDLLQNVPGKMSQYDGVSPFREFKNTQYFSDIHADLTNVDVTILYLVRSSVPQQKWPEHYRFWEEYFVSQGASINRIKPIYGEK
jgi:hypothetical protein